MTTVQFYESLTLRWLGENSAVTAPVVEKVTICHTCKGTLIEKK
jgi:hypothetical protein